MTILVMSKPDGSLADLLLKSDVSTLICVTQDDVHLRFGAGGVVSGADIDCPQKIEIDVPAIKAQLLKAYPLIDRWVSRNQSVSTSLEQLLEYTVTLIQIIGNYSPRFAVLETGAPHHLFSYCLDVALNYLSIKHYYLYGNAYDGRCIVFEGNDKRAVVRIPGYSAESAIEGYINEVQRSTTYTPGDTSKAIAVSLHKWLPYAIYLHLRHIVAKYRVGLLRERRLHSNASQINLRMPHVGFFEGISILNKHRKYLNMLNANGTFQVGKIQSSDIVYVGHMLPEATSCPEAPDYPDEIDVLVDLKNRFPDSKIYYREHPAIELFSQYGDVHFQGLHKCPSFYQLLVNLGIEVVPHSIHISKIRDRGCLFATKTGRVAVENSVLGLTTIIYGYPFYGVDLPRACHISKLPTGSTVQSIKDSTASVPDPASAVKSYLVGMFSGSIENPGIGLSPNPDVRLEFETSFVSLVHHLRWQAGNPAVSNENEICAASSPN